MPNSLASIVQEGIHLTLRSWIVLIILIGLRTAAGIAAAFPIILGFVLLVRLLLFAPVDPTTGYPDPEILLSGYFTDPSVLAAIAALCAIAYVFHFLLTTLTDGGIVGELGQAIREGRTADAGSFLRNSLRFFGRMAILRIAFTAITFTANGLGILVMGLILWKTGLTLNGLDPMGSREIVVILGGLGLLVAYMTTIKAGVFWLAMAVAVAMGMEDLPLRQAWRSAGRHLKREAASMATAFAFFIAIALAWTALSLAGNLWWSTLQTLDSSWRWPGTAASAWDLTFSIVWEAWAIMVLAVQLVLYARSRQLIPAVPVQLPTSTGKREVDKQAGISSEPGTIDQTC